MTGPANDRPQWTLARGLGLVLLVGWLALWACSFAHNQFCARVWSWLPLWDRLSIDFTGNFLCSRVWVAGADPYRLPFASPVPVTYGYTPQTLWHFAWCAAMPSIRVAAIVWFLASSAIICFAVRQCLRARTGLSLRPVDPALALALVLFSSPVLFELERANCNAIVLFYLLIAAAALKVRSLPADAIVGVAVALASWVKIYPAIAIPALLILCRPRAALLAAGFGVVFGSLDLGGLASFWQQRLESAAIHYPGVNGSYYLHDHPIGAWWMLLWRKAGVHTFDALPEPLVAGALMLPLIVAASRPILNLDPAGRTKIALPYLLWMVSAGTFTLPIAHDYNLLFFPLAVVCLYNPTGPWLASALLAFSLPWLQPMRVPVDPFVMTVFKICGLAGAAASLRASCAELPQRVAT